MTSRSDTGAHSYHQGTTEKSIRAGLGRDDIKKGSGAKTFLTVLIGIVIGIMATTLGYAIATRTTDETTSNNNGSETSETREKCRNNTKCVDAPVKTGFSDEYIYIPEWGVKFDKPEGYINYLFDDIATHNRLVFWAAPKGTQGSSLSGYERYVSNKDGLLTVSAIPHEDYNNTTLDVYWGEKIFENDKYVFVRNHAQAIFSEDANDIENEKKASDLLIELTDSISNI